MAASRNQPSSHPKWWLLAAGVALIAALLGVRLFFWARSSGRDEFSNLDFGVAAVPGVEEEGFHAQEEFKGEPFRWTDGHAKLVIPISKSRPPQSLELHLHSFRPPNVATIRLRVAADGRDLFHDDISVGKWERVFDLTGFPFREDLTLEIESDTFAPKGVMDKGKSDDPRTLGIQVKRIRLSAPERR